MTNSRGGAVKYKMYYQLGLVLACNVYIIKRTMHMPHFMEIHIPLHQNSFRHIGISKKPLSLNNHPRCK